MSSYKISPENQTIEIKTLLDRIDKGYELQEIKGELTEDEILKYNSAIILTPDYQREYRFTTEDEIKLVESVLVGIPIPPIFLATDKFKNVRVTNVVDGQHRLRALHRFRNNKVKLNNMDLLSVLNNKKYEDLELEVKADFNEHTLSIIVFKDFPGKNFELEIFNRYNKGTKPLSPQEIRHAVYNSIFNEFVNDFTLSLYKNEDIDEDLERLKIAYNVSKDRIQKKKVQEGMFVILNILENGINESYQKSLDYAEEYMKEKSELENTQSEDADNNFKEVKNKFTKFNKFIITLQKDSEYPFSRELYGVSSRNYKFQISIAMILAGIFQMILQRNKEFDVALLDGEEQLELINVLKSNLKDSYLENPMYNASSTNSKEIKKLIEKIFEELYEKKLIY